MGYQLCFRIAAGDMLSPRLRQAVAEHVLLQVVGTINPELVKKFRNATGDDFPADQSAEICQLCIEKGILELTAIRDFVTGLVL
jgi:hypothetical protein